MLTTVCAHSYDSKDAFDDSIPSKLKDGDDFYKVFGPVFVANSRWSITQPAPLLGDAKTPFEKVDKMYDFWFKFKSWREFADDDEHNVDDAQCREEKRWMERNNERQRQKLKNKENTRIRTLVETSCASAHPCAALVLVLVLVLVSPETRDKQAYPPHMQPSGLTLPRNARSSNYSS